MWCAARTFMRNIIPVNSAQHQLRAGIVRVDRELFHQIIADFTKDVLL